MMCGTKLRALTLGLLLGASAFTLALTTNGAVAQSQAAGAATQAAQQANLAAARVRRDGAAAQYLGLGKAYTNSLICGTKAEQDALKKKLDAAKFSLDNAIHDEADSTPEYLAAHAASVEADQNVADLQNVPDANRTVEYANKRLVADEAADAAHEHALQVQADQVKRIEGEVEAASAGPETGQCPSHSSVRSGMLSADFGNFHPKESRVEKQTEVAGSIQIDLNNARNGFDVGRNSSAADPIPAQLGSVGWPIIQLDAKYAHVDSTSSHLNAWNIGASAFVTVANWQFGPAFRFQSQSAGGGFTSQTFDYGAFAQWFATDRLTAVANVGGFSGNFSNKGFYTGGTLKAYPHADVALFGGIDYARFTSFGGSDEIDYTLGGEALLSESTPVSLFAGYSHSTFTGGNNVNTVFVGLNFYVNTTGAATLIDRQRSGQIKAYSNRFSSNVGSR